MLGHAIPALSLMQVIAAVPGSDSSNHAAESSDSRTAAMASGRFRLDHPEWVLNLGADGGLGGFDQVQQSSFRGVWQGKRLPGRIVRSCTLAAVITTEWIRAESLSTPARAFIPKQHRLPFLVCCFSGSRLPFIFSCLRHTRAAAL